MVRKYRVSVPVVVEVWWDIEAEDEEGAQEADPPGWPEEGIRGIAIPRGVGMSCPDADSAQWERITVEALP